MRYHKIIRNLVFITLSAPLAFAEEAVENRSKAIAALEQLEQRTGRTAEELLPAIEMYSSMLDILSDDLESGAVKKEELTDFKVISENLFAAMREDWAADATTKLMVLRSLNAGDEEKLAEWLREGVADYYASILRRENETAAAYRGAVEKEAAKDSNLAEAIAAAKAEIQNDARPEPKSEGDQKPQP